MGTRGSMDDRGQGRAPDLSPYGDWRPRVIVAVTVPRTAFTFLRGQLAWFRERGFEMTLVASPGRELAASAEREGVRARSLNMEREVSPLRDLRSLRDFIRLLRMKRPDLTHVSTPKAGFLGGVAAWLTRVPCRVYTMRGLRLETARGRRRLVLWTTEWIACRTAHIVIVVSPSLAQRAQRLLLVHPRKVVVIGQGSSNGVLAARFEPTADRRRAAQQLRIHLSISPSAPVIGFVGRLSRDKGLLELVTAFETVARRLPDARLLIVGEIEADGPRLRDVMTSIASDPRIIVHPWLDDIAIVYHAMNVLALPTYREGFPNVVLEAAAAGLPVVTTRATGAIDSVRDGETGILVEPRDWESLARALLLLLSDPVTAHKMGAAGSAWVRHAFPPEIVWQGIRSVYGDLLSRAASKGQLQPID
jgi:glycosyltransferase involved in cell wall biosynthesis